MTAGLSVACRNLNGSPVLTHRRPVDRSCMRGPIVSKRKCRMPGCTKHVQVPREDGLCRRHWREDNPLTPRVLNRDKTCDGSECDRPVKAAGYCKTHGVQMRTRGRVWVIGSVVGRQALARCLAYACGEQAVVGGACAAHAVTLRGQCWVVACVAPIRNKTLGLCDVHTRKDTFLRHHYGISVSEREDLAVEQGFGCAACGELEVPGSMSLHVDHDHSTGSVRGLLCGNCNRAIGLFRDNPRALRRAASYLEVSRAL